MQHHPILETIYLMYSNPTTTLPRHDSDDDGVGVEGDRVMQ